MAGRTSVDPWVASYENLALSVDELQADTSDDQKMAQARVRAMTRQNIQRAAESVRQLQQQLDDAVLAGRMYVERKVTPHPIAHQPSPIVRFPLQNRARARASTIPARQHLSPNCERAQDAAWKSG